MRNIGIFQDNFPIHWISVNTQNSISVVDFGAGYFGKLSFVSPNVKYKIGIEIFQEYIDESRFEDCVKVNGNFLKYRELVNSKFYDTALIIDALEHVTKEEAFKFIQMLQEDFNRILLEIPIGNHPQKGNKNKWQEHKSTWSVNEIELMGFDVVYISNYHTDKQKDSGCLFANWEKV